MGLSILSDGTGAATPLAIALVLAVGCGDSVGGNAVATSARIASAPSSVTAGAAFGVTVELLGPDGALATSASNKVTLTLANGELAITGTTTATANDGVATFTNLSITTAATDHRLIADGGGASAVSAPFEVTPGAVAPNEANVSPPPGNVPPNAETVLTFSFKDSFGNPTPGRPITLSSNLAGATFLPTDGVTSEAGTFETRFIPNATGSATITATVDATPITIATPYVSVELCTASGAMAFPGSVVGSQPCGAYVSTAVTPSQFSFTSPGGGAAFTITSTFDPVVQLLGAPHDNTPTFFPDATPATFEWLLPPGPYLFRVATASGPGTFALSGTAVTGNSPGVPRVLFAGGEYLGQSLSTGDLRFSDNSFFDAYYFYSLSPCRITMRTPAFRAYLIVADAVTGQSLAPDKSAGQGDIDLITHLGTCRGAQTNPILIVVNSVGPGEAGPYTLRVDSPPPPPTAMIASGDDPTKGLKPVRLNARDLARIVSGLKRIAERE